MPNGPRLLIKNSCYHIIARGNQKQVIFKSNLDYEEYLKRISHYKVKYQFKLYSFCLMPNHIHMIGQIEKEKNLSKFMHGLNRSYTAYFNEKYNKVGYLWQGRFKSKIITKDKYLIDCLTYIELNPVRANIVTTPYEYKWSSYKERVLKITSNGRLINALAIQGTAS
ncbi:MAG: transposase [Candidatus Omnitrophota bacterium]